MYGRILVAVDGSEPSSRAFEEALRLAADQHAVVRVVHVIDLGISLAPWAQMAFVNYDQVEAALRESGTHIVDAALARAHDAGVEVDSAMLETEVDDVAGEVLAEADRWKADLLVLGTHGRHGLAHLILGSVAEGVVRRARGPVLLMRQADDAAPAG
jgi:nucleotide-binding universal stress UspA family protein